MKEFKKFSNADWALYIAKLYDLDADAMNDIIDNLDDNNADEVLDKYSDKMDPTAVKILSHDFSDDFDFEYYEIENTVDEWSSSVTGMYATIEDAKEDLKNKCDWYREKGTGTINRIWFKIKANGTVEKYEEEVYQSK